MEHARPPGTLYALMSGVLIAVGAVMLTVACFGLSAVMLPQSAYHSREVTRLPRESGVSSRTHSNINLQPTLVSLFFVFGAVAFLGGMLLRRRRFSLKFLLAAVFIIGILGMLPLKLKSGLNATAVIRVDYDRPLSVEQLQSVRDALEPYKAYATLPDSLREKLPLLSAVKRVTVQPTSRKDVFSTALAIEISPEVSAGERDTVIDFYFHYFDVLVLQAARENKAVFLDGAADPGFITREWAGAVREWEQRRRGTQNPAESTPSEKRPAP
ncbi:MAG TPA: hypothetical protein VEK08_20040 [Planctomycetota bacterium]|nr:hypothetical protein [Planctomycetota bacterium]